MTDFVPPGSIVRRIWGDADVVLLVFAGSAAEFALNRAVDWLFFTGELPRDPLGRLFSTAAYAQEIVFADEARALAALGRIRAAHQAVERARGARIPDWAHRDVLYMLIDYSARGWELLHRPLTDKEREELYGVFRRVGEGLAIPDLPPDHAAWRADRARHLERDLARTPLTAELYARFRKALGAFRYHLFLRVQSVLCPPHVRRLLGLRRIPGVRPVLRSYRLLARMGLRPLVRRALLPPEHLPAVLRMDHAA